MTSTITPDQEQAIRAWLEEHPTLSVGMGSSEQACSIAAINLALSGDLTDLIPECMSQVIGVWVITAQDEMPGEIRNSAEWRALLPLAAGTGRDHERERMDIILEGMWEKTLPLFTSIAEENGFGAECHQMLTERTAGAAYYAAGAAYYAARPESADYQTVLKAERAAAVLALCEAHAGQHEGVIEALAEKWNTSPKDEKEETK
jgi:hypothetical protein